MAFDPFAEERGASAPFDPFATDTAPAKKQNKGLIADIGTDLKRGVQQLPGAITGLADIAVGGISGKPLISNLADSAGEATGFQPAKWAKSAEAEYSPSRQAGRAEVDAAWENGTASDIAGAYLKNPMNIVGSVAESLPSMIAGGLAGRAALGIGAKAVSAGAGGVGPALPGIIARTVGTGLAPAVGAGIGEGGIMAGQAMANSLDAGVDPRTAAGYAGATGLVGGALGALGGKVAQRFGVVDPETLIAGGIGRQGSNATGLAAAKEVGKRMAGGAISEGLFEELPQSVFEQGFQNLAQDKPLTEGMARAGVEGALAGSFMGGAFNAIPGGRYAESKINAQTKPQDKQQPIAGLLPSPTYTGTPGEQIVAADAERQAAIDAADKNAADLYAMRDAFEAARQNVTLVADPVPVQQRIDAMLGLDTTRMDKKGRALYEKDLAAAFNEPIGITHDANQREVPFTMGEYLDAQVKADDAVRARERIPAQTANQQASSRLAQLADEEAQQHAAITQDLVQSASQGGALSKAALTGIQTGATQMPVHPERAAIEQQMLADEAAQAELAPIERLMRTRSDEQVQRIAENENANPKMRQVAIADLQRRMATKAQPTTTSPLQQTATQLNMPAQNGIKQLQAQLEQTEPFTEQSSALTEKLQSAVTQDAQSALNAGEMPVYKVTDRVSVAIHPSAQNPGMVQVTRYTKDGVIGDSQYNNVDDAVRQEGLTHKPRIASNEAVAVIEKSIQAESEYQQRKSAAPQRAEVKSDSSLNRDSSWVIRNKETGEVVMETFDRKKVDALNTSKYEAVPIQEYLGSLNVQSAPNAAPVPNADAGIGVGGISRKRSIENWTADELQARLNRADTGESPLTPESRQKIEAELAKRPARKAPVNHGLSVGKAPNSAAPVTVRNGIIFIGDEPAVNYDTEQDIKIASDATPRQIVDALKSGGAIATSQRFYGLPAEPKAEKQKPDRRQIDATKDTLFQAIAKLGGMDTQELTSNGFDQKDISVRHNGRVIQSGKNKGQLTKPSFKSLSLGFNMPLHKKGGMSFDGVLEELKQHGYFPEDATKNDAIEAFRRELGGDAVMTPDAAMQQAEMQAEQEENDAIGYDDLSDREKALVDFHAENIYDEDSPIEAFKRGMKRDGATEDEINEAIKQTFGTQETGNNDSGGTPQGTGETRDAQGAWNGSQDGEVQEGAEPDWLTGQTNEQAASELAKRKADIAEEKRQHEELIAKAKRESNAKEKARRAAQVLAEREAAKKAEVDKAAEDFALGQEAPAPVERNVTTEDARGQRDVFAQPAQGQQAPEKSERESAELRYKEILSQWKSKSLGKMWKPTTPLEIKVEAEKLMATLSSREQPAQEPAQPVKATTEAKAVEPAAFDYDKAYQDRLSHLEKRAASFGLAKIKGEASDGLAGMVLGREFGESIESFFAKRPDIKAKYDATKAWIDGDKPAAVDAKKEAETDDRDHFTLERLNRETNQMEPVTFARGEYVRYTLSGQDVFGEIDGISHARREFAVDGLWYPFGFAYKSERPAEEKKQTVPLSSVIDSVNAKNGEGLTEADRIATVDSHRAFMERLNNGDVTIDEFKARFESVKNSKAALLAELGTKTKQELLKLIGGYRAERYKNDKKDKIVSEAYRNMLDDFVLGDSISYGFGAKYEDVIGGYVGRYAQADIQAYADKIKEAKAERANNRAKNEEAIAAPQTLNDFMLKVRASGIDSLTAEERRKYEDLRAEATMKARQESKQEIKTTVAANTETVGAEIKQTKHSKTGADLFVVVPAQRVERDSYNAWNAAAKKLGGWYSSYRGTGAIPGFQFKTMDAAEAFKAYISEGDTQAAQQMADARQEERADDREGSAVERLRAMADKVEESANDDLGRDRNTNTARRARMASGAEAAARKRLALGRTMRNIAGAIESGEAKFLGGLRTKAQVEQLMQAIQTAHDDMLRDKHPSYGDFLKHQGDTVTAESVDKVKYPTYEAYVADLSGIAGKLAGRDGSKTLSARLRKIVSDQQEAEFSDVVKENPLKFALFKQGTMEPAIFGTEKFANAVLMRSGLAGKAQVVTIGRGKHVVTISRDMAVEQKRFTPGDRDKVTLKPEFAESVLAAVDNYNATKSRFDQVTLGWWLPEVRARRKRLDAMNLTNTPELRAAMREFIKFRDEIPEADPVKEMERALIGRKDVGVDFFPTPAGVATDMVQRAGVGPGMAVLEPSAGNGNIAEAIREAGVVPDTVEMSTALSEILEAKGFPVVGRDFMDMDPRSFTYGDTFEAPDGTRGIMRGGNMDRVRLVNQQGESLGYFNRDELKGIEKNGSESGYDRIVMNPPFGGGADMRHVRHAYELLKPGGRIVAVVGEGAFNRSDKQATEFRAWLDELGAEVETLPENTFRDANLMNTTGANARIVTIEKPETDKGVTRYSKADAAQAEHFPRAQAESRIKSILGDKLGKVLIDSGIVTFTNKGNEYQGATYKDGSIVLNLDALSADNVDGIFAHEGFHSTIKELVGQETYAKLMKQLENMHAMGRGAQWVKDANAAIPSDTKAEHRTEELAAYAIERYVNGAKQPNIITRWVESLLSALRTAIIRRLPFGKLKSWAVNNLQPQDLANLAIAGLKAKAREVAATSYTSAGYADARMSKTQERTVRAVVPGSSEPVQYGEAGGKVSIKDFNAFVNRLKDGQPIDSYSHKQKIADLVEEIEADWSNGSSDDYSNSFGPDEIYADLHKENDAEYFDGDGDLTDSGSSRYNELERELSTKIAKDEIGEPERQSVSLNKAGDMAKIVHAYLEKLGIEPSAISGSGKSDSKYFSVEINGEQKTVRVSDHQIPVEYKDRNGAADYEIALYDVGDDVRSDGRITSNGITEEEASRRAVEVINSILQTQGREATAFSKINQTALFDVDRSWRDLIGRNKFSDFDIAPEFIATRNDDVSIVAGLRNDPTSFTLSKQDGKQWAALHVEEINLDNGKKAFTSSLEVGSDGFKKGTGIATRMYLAALNVAQQRNIGWMSEGIRSDNALAIYRKLKSAGIPFNEVGNASYVDAESLSNVDLQEVAKKIIDFPITNPDIRYSRAKTANQSAFDIPEPSKIDDVIYAMQDKQVDLRRVVQSIKKAGGNLTDSNNAYLQEELFHGRASKGVQDFLNNELRPLVAQMRSLNVEMADFEEYLWNRHAEERNQQIAKINDQMPDAGSGIKTADARAYLKALDPAKKSAYESLAKRINAINRSSQEILVKSGLEKQETIDAWNGAYSNYVPLHREDVDTGHVGTGKGYSIRGSASKRAVGSNKPVVDILANIAMQRERNIVRAEKNRVSNALYGLAAANPNADLWQVDKAPTERVVQNKAVYKVVDDTNGVVLDEFDRMEDAERYSLHHDNTSVEQSWADKVVSRIVPGFRQQDNVIHTRINGEDHFVIMDEKNPRSVRMAQAIKNLDMDQLGRVLSNTAKATRYMAAINTQYNPVFGVVNLMRDTQGAMLNLSTTPLAGQQKKVLGYTISALRGIYADLRDHRQGKTPSSSWAKEFEEFQNAGGQTGYRDQYSNAAERADAISKELKSLDRNWLLKRGGAMFDWLSDYNESMENAVRLASFKAAKESGMSVEQAASLAKNLTVNFNRKGQVATQMGALYAFFNASVQGTARLAETMAGPMGKKILYGGLLLGSMQAMLLAASGMGDDEPPEFVRERSIIIPIGDGKYISIPMPLGFHVIPNLSRIPTEFVMSGFKEPAKRVADLFGLFADTFNPIGNAGLSLQTISPTVIDPLAALSENRDWTGKPIAKLDRDSLNPTPGYLRAKDTATSWSRAISYGFNLLSGGTDYKKGLFSPTPDQIDYLIGQATGGVGREVSKAEQTGMALATGEELPMHKIPLFGRFIGDTAGQSAEGGKFYASIQRINEHENEIKGLREKKDAEGIREYIKDNPEAMLVVGANHVEREIQKLKAIKREAVKADDTQRVKAIESQITNRMKMFNDRVRSLSEKNAA